MQYFKCSICLLHMTCFTHKEFKPSEVKFIHTQLREGFSLSKWKTKTSNRDETKESVSDCNLEAWLWNSKVSPWFHLLILCFHHTLQRDTKWRQAWKELTEGGGSMWWYDHSLSDLACCVHACVCVWMFECVHMCACFESSLALISMFSVQHLPPPYCCRIGVQEGSPIGPEKWDCTSISLAATGLERLLS